MTSNSLSRGNGNSLSQPLTERLTDLAGSGDKATRRAAELLSKMPRPMPLSSAALSRIEERLLPPDPGPVPGPGPGAGGSSVGTALRWVGLGTAVVVATAGTAFLVGERHQRTILHPVPAAPVASPQPAELPLPAPVVAAPEEPTAPALMPPPAVEPTPAHPARPLRSAPRTRPAAVSSVAAPQPAPQAASAASGEAESGLLAESRLLGKALHQLHQERDAQAALGSLTAYELRFPHGMLGEEAQAARIDALLLLERRDEALSLLDHTTFTRLARGGELRVVRGELRAAGGRCGEAIGDFSWTLSHQPTASMAERALYGRAACRAKLHDTDGAHADYQDYIQRFPGGKFSAAAQAATSRLSRP